MLVQLYIYDLSRGLARNFSGALLGIQINAVYHTSIVFEGIEYCYDGGVKTVKPGETHLGKPLQVKDLGHTDLPMDVILEYLESLRSIYTFEVGHSRTCLSPRPSANDHCRLTISGNIIVITSRTILLPSWLAKAFQATSQTFRTRCLGLHLAE